MDSQEHNQCIYHSRLLRNFEEKGDDKDTIQTLISVSQLHKDYADQCPCPENNVPAAAFGKYVSAFFPGVRVIRKTLIGDDHSTYYYDILRRIKDNGKTTDDAIMELVQKYNMILTESDSSANNYKFILVKECTGSKVYMEIKLSQHYVNVSCGNTDVNLQELQFGDTVDMDYQGISAIGRFCAQIRICNGMEYTKKSHTLVGSVVTDSICVGNETKKYLRSTRCTRVLKIIGLSKACSKCRQAEHCCQINKVSIMQNEQFTITNCANH